MEQLQFDVGTLEQAVAVAVKEEMTVSVNAKEILHDASRLSEDELFDCISRCVACSIAEEVVRYSDYDPVSLAAFFGQGSVLQPASVAKRNASKANARPSWFKPLHRGGTEIANGDGLTNCVITGWRGFDHTLSTAARAAVKDTMKTLTSSVVGAFAVWIAEQGQPELAALAGVALSYVGGVVAETMSSLTTVAFGLHRVDPAMQCVYQRAMRVSRNSRSAVMGGPHEVSVKDIIVTFKDDAGNEWGTCSDLYNSKAPDCPFCKQKADGADECMLVNPSSRPSEWHDNEDGETKIRRIMGGLQAQGVLTSKIERDKDRFFRANRLITSYDTFGRR